MEHKTPMVSFDFYFYLGEGMEFYPSPLIDYIELHGVDGVYHGIYIMNENYNN